MPFEKINGKKRFIEHYRYEGIFLFDRDSLGERAEKLTQLCASQRPGFDYGEMTIRVNYEGKDNNRHVVKSLAKIASILGDCESTLRCFLYSNGGEVVFIESFDVSKSRLIKRTYSLKLISKTKLDFLFDFEEIPFRL